MIVETHPELRGRASADKTISSLIELGFEIVEKDPKGVFALVNTQI
jgi:hypothetical protein